MEWKWYINDATTGTADSYEDAVKIMDDYNLQSTGRHSCDGSKEYFSEDGELDDNDDGAYTPSITAKR